MTVTVRPGDSLWRIAQRNGVSLDALLAANPHIRNPRLIHVGQRVEIPGARDSFEHAPSSGGRTYRVQVGDSMAGIAARAGISLGELLAANPQVQNARLIFPGQELNIPSRGRVPEQPGPVTTGTRRSGSSANPYYDEFVRAARKAGVPESWASNPALIQLVKHESGFRPGAKNPRSTAFGLFQFLSSTWRSYLREVPYGTRDPYWQAVGGFRYIKARYGTPERAWAFWQATVNRNANIAPPDLRGLARTWIARGYAGY